MNSEAAKDLQISLQTTLSAVAVQRDLENSDDSSSVSSSLTTTSSAGSQHVPPSHETNFGIPLKIAHWANLSQTSVSSTDQGRERARDILQYFADVGKGFGLGETPCVGIIEEAIEICKKGSDPKLASKLSGADRMVQKTPENAPSYSIDLQDFVLSVPLFHIFEAMCWIYTCCVESDQILTDREVELYLYQLQVIFQAFKNSGWIGNKSFPSTIAAAWNKPVDKKTPLLVAFACSCAGKQETTRQEMNAIRRKYVRRLHNLVDICSETKQRNGAGNCPEFIVWGTVCQQDGSYRSLCLSITANMTYKCCDHCELLAKETWKKSRMRIEDWYANSSLATGKEKDNHGYKAMDLKDVKPNYCGGKRKESFEKAW